MEPKTRVDHLQRIGHQLIKIQSGCRCSDRLGQVAVGAATGVIYREAEALQLDAARLRSYALALQRQGVANGTIARLQVEHGVVDLLRGGDRSSHRQNDEDWESRT